MTWFVDRLRRKPYVVKAPVNDGLPGNVVIGQFAYKTHALLAAAAPDLLDVAHRYVTLFAEEHDPELWDMANEAIFKARGL